MGRSVVVRAAQIWSRTRQGGCALIVPCKTPWRRWEPRTPRPWTISLSFSAKIPGPALQLGNVDMDFSYAEHFGSSPATGYERLLHDALLGDPTLFQRKDTVEAAWSAVEPILDVWGALPPRDFPNYRAGTWGPKAADELLARDGRAWRTIQE
jgi:glucose-6-phosphate 1-dehydrogenase